MWPSVFWIHRSWGWCGEAVVLNFCHCIVIHWGSLVKIHHRSDITVMLNIHRQTPLLWHFHFCVSKYMQRENDGCQSLKSVPHWILPVSLCNKNFWEIPWCIWSRCKNLSWHYDNTRVNAERVSSLSHQGTIGVLWPQEWSWQHNINGMDHREITLPKNSETSSGWWQNSYCGSEPNLINKLQILLNETVIK